MSEVDATYLVIVLFGLALIGFSYIKKMGLRGKAVTPEQLKGMLDARQDLLILDVRTPGEFKGDGHIPGAVNVPLHDLAGRLAAIAQQLAGHRDTPVVVVCRTQNRSGQALRLLEGKGLGDVKLLAGGMLAWRSSNLPTVR